MVLSLALDSLPCRGVCCPGLGSSRSAAHRLLGMRNDFDIVYCSVPTLCGVDQIFDPESEFLFFGPISMPFWERKPLKVSVLNPFRLRLCQSFGLFLPFFRGLVAYWISPFPWSFLTLSVSFFVVAGVMDNTFFPISSESFFLF